MKREISGTGVATALLLLAAAVLLCTKLNSLEATDIKLPVAAILPLEILIYGGLLYVWSGRLSPLTLAAGVPALVLLRIGICAAGAIGAAATGGPRQDIAGSALSPTAPVWCAAVAFAVISFYPVRGALVASSRKRGRGKGGKAKAAAPQSKVAFDAQGALAGVLANAESAAGSSRPAEDGEVFQVLEARRKRGNSEAPLIELPVEGWVTLPAAVLLEQLPAGTEAAAAQVEIPLRLIVPRLREGELRIPVMQLDEIVTLPPGPSDDKMTVTLPLELVVPQLPDLVLELPECDPPAWLAVDAELEDIFFAKV